MFLICYKVVNVATNFPHPKVTCLLRHQKFVYIQSKADNLKIFRTCSNYLGKDSSSLIKVRSLLKVGKTCKGAHQITKTKTF